MATRLRILCLHGFTSNGTVHAHQVRRITALMPEYDFIFHNVRKGPHEVDIATQMDLSKPGNQAWSDLVTSLSESGHRAWWYARDGARDEKSFVDDEKTGGFYGLEDSLASIGALIRETGPIHAIWGFSQGACFAGMLCALFQDRLADHPLRRHLGAGTEVKVPKAGVVFSGFRARFPQYDSVYETCGIAVPTLHVMGEKDEAVSGERSQRLVDVCSDTETLSHPGGHDIPKSPEHQMRIARFLRKHLGGEHGPGDKVQASM